MYVINVCSVCYQYTRQMRAIKTGIGRKIAVGSAMGSWKLRALCYHSAA